MAKRRQDVLEASQDLLEGGDPLPDVPPSSS
jgi:hypothetical protein